MTTITANDLKRQGVASIAEALKSAPEATISVRGKKCQRRPDNVLGEAV